MRNFKTSRKLFFPLANTRWSMSLLLMGVLVGGGQLATRAESPQTAPVELTEVLREIESAANSVDLPGLMEFYSPNFNHSDGLEYDTFFQALSQMWSDYPRIKYRTSLLSWSREGRELVAETETEILASKRESGRLIFVTSTVRSRQYFEDKKLLRQEILSERTEVNSGSNPPEVKIILPETVQVGEEFNFDVIVQEPLGDDLLLGNAIEEETGGTKYLNPSSFELELLPAGGIFKRVTAPQIADNRWVSAIIVRRGGITMITQRVRVELVP